MIETMGTLAGLGALGISLNELLKNPDMSRAFFDDVAKEIKETKEDAAKAVKAKAKAAEIKKPQRPVMTRMERIGRLTNKRINPLVEEDLAMIDKLSETKSTWKQGFSFERMLKDKPVDSQTITKEALKRTTRVMFNTPALKMNVNDIQTRMNYINSLDDELLMEHFGKLYTTMDEKLPSHLRADFRNQFVREYGKQRNFLKDNNLPLVSHNDLFVAWNKEEQTSRKIYKNTIISEINHPPEGGIAKAINDVFDKSNTRRLTSDEFTTILKNFSDLEDVYKKNVGRPLNYGIQLVEDELRGGFAVMARVSYRGSRLTTDIPLLANREATFGFGLDLTKAKGGITYQASSFKKGYQSAVMMPGEVPDIKGGILSTEQFMIREFDRMYKTLKEEAPGKDIHRALDIELKRQVDIFADRTVNVGQRLLPNAKGTQAAIAVLAGHQAVITDPNFNLTDQLHVNTVGMNPALKILDLAPSAIGGSEGARVFQADAPTIETQLRGFNMSGDDILPTDKTASFRKSIELTGKTEVLGTTRDAPTLSSTPRPRAGDEINAIIKKQRAKETLTVDEQAKLTDFRQREKKWDINRRQERIDQFIKKPNEYDAAIRGGLIDSDVSESAYREMVANDQALKGKALLMHQGVIESWKRNKAAAEEAAQKSITALRDSDFIGYKMTDPNVRAATQNKKFLPIIFQDGTLDAHYRLEYQMGEGLYMGKSYGFVSDASAIKNVSQFTPKWADIWKEAKDKPVFISKDKLKDIGKSIGMNDAGNVMSINLRGSHIRGIEVTVNPTTGDFIYRTHYDKGDFSKAKGLSVKGQIKDTSSETIYRETAHALGIDDVTSGKKKAVSLLGRAANAVISDMDQVIRGPGAIKEATLGGASLLLSNKDQATWRKQVDSFLDNLTGNESITEYSKRVFGMLEANQVDPELAAFNIRGSFLNGVAGKDDLVSEEAALKKWADTYGSSDYSKQAFAFSRKQRGFLGGSTLSYDTPSELGGAGKMASVERRAMHSMLVNMEHAGIGIEQQADVMADIVRRVDGSRAGNWRTTYDTMNAAFFSIQDPTYFNERNLAGKRPGTRISKIRLQSADLKDIMGMLDSTEFKESHLIELDLAGTLIGRKFEAETGATSIYIPGARGVPDIDRIQLKKDKATVSMVDEYIAARDGFLKTALSPEANEEQVTKELFNLRNQLGVGAAETIRQNLTGKVAGSAQGRFLTLMDDKFLDKTNFRSTSYFNQMRKLAEKDQFQSVFVKDAVFMQQIKGLKSSAGFSSKAMQESSREMAREHIKNFFFRGGEGYNTGFFSRNPTLGEGHGILTKQRRYLDENVNDVLLSNKRINDLLALMAGKKEGDAPLSYQSRRKMLIGMFNDRNDPMVTFKDASGNQVTKSAQEAFSDIVYDDIGKLHGKSLEAQGASIYSPMSKENLTYEWSQNGSEFKGETSKKLFYSRAYRSIADSDGDVAAMLLAGSKEANAAMTSAIKAGDYAKKMFRADVEFDVMNKRIGITQAANMAGGQALTATERITSFFKKIMAKNVGQYSISIDTLKSGILSREGMDPVRRRQHVDLLLAIEENMLKAKKVKGKLENFGDMFAEAIRENNYESYKDLLEKRVAKFTDVDTIKLAGETHTMKYGEMFDELWESMSQYKWSKGLPSRSLKDVRNKSLHDDALTEEKGARMAKTLESLEKGSMSFVNAAANASDDVLEDVVPIPDSITAEASKQAAVDGSNVQARDAATAANSASTGVKKPLNESLFDRAKSFDAEAAMKWARGSRNELMIAGGIAALGLGTLAISGSPGQQNEPIIENPFRATVVPREQVLQPETYIQMDSGRANIELAGLHSLPGVSNVLATSGIRKQALVVSDNRPPITKSYIDKRER